jgi:hypothetical protein
VLIMFSKLLRFGRYKKDKDKSKESSPSKPQRPASLMEAFGFSDHNRKKKHPFGSSEDTIQVIAPRRFTNDSEVSLVGTRNSLDTVASYATAPANFGMPSIPQVPPAAEETLLRTEIKTENVSPVRIFLEPIAPFRMNIVVYWAAWTYQYASLLIDSILRRGRFWNHLLRICNCSNAIRSKSSWISHTNTLA